MRSGHRGHDFHCSGLVSDEENAKFMMRYPNTSYEIKQFLLFTNITAEIQHAPGWNASQCSGMPDVDASVHYMKDTVQLNEVFAEGSQSCSTVFMATRLFCVRGAGPNSLDLSISVQANVNAKVDVHLGSEQGTDETRRSISMDIGGNGGRSAFHLFRVPEDDELDIWRISLNVPEEFRTPNNVFQAHILHSSSPCLSRILNRGGCIDPVKIWSCTRSVPVSFRRPSPVSNLRTAMRLSFSNSTRMTLSRGSLPALRSGRWLLFVACNWEPPMQACSPSLIDVEFSPGYSQRSKLWVGAAIMVFGPAGILFCVNAMYWVAYFVLYRISSQTPAGTGRKSHLWPVFMARPSHRHLAMLREKVHLIFRPIPFFPALLALMVGVFLATAAQFVITHYGLMVRTGNRDICFYNEKCFYPGVVWDVPWNHFLSNLAYFVAGVHTMLQAFFAEVRCRNFLQRTMSEMFKALNLNSEQALTKQKWISAFDEVDKDRSGRVSRHEWYTHNGHAIAFDFIDRNHDGKISREEWSNAFDRLDTESDGTLSEAQFQTASSDIDLRAFYAVATTFIAEGIGSMCYHLCPSVETFQFDTCFMIPIANLLTIALADWSRTDLDTISAMRYFAYILTPVWLINFIGTWYDIDVFDSNWLYWVYTFFVVAPQLNFFVFLPWPMWRFTYDEP